MPAKRGKLTAAQRKQRRGTAIQIEGLNKVVRDMQRLGVEIDDLKDVFSAIAKEGARLASSFAPKRSGKLAKSVRGNKAKNNAVIIAGKKAVPYAAPINYGWRKRNIQPSEFMQDASAALKPRAISMLESGLDRAIRKAGLQ
jgi:hypothetical protein